MSGVYQGGLDCYEAAQPVQTDGGVRQRKTTAASRNNWYEKMIQDQQ
jgi:hypothetical protein